MPIPSKLPSAPMAIVCSKNTRVTIPAVAP